MGERTRRARTKDCRFSTSRPFMPDDNYAPPLLNLLARAWLSLSQLSLSQHSLSQHSLSQPQPRA